MKDLEGKVAVVTGSTRGIGRVTAIELAKRGATVVISGRTEVPLGKKFGSLQTTKAEIEELGGKVLAVPANLADPEGVDILANTVLEKFGGCDILINNAAFMGRAFGASVYDIEPKNWNITLNVNVNAPIWLTQKLAPTMRERGGGIVINLTSGAGDFTKGPGRVKGFAYGTTKAALNLMSQRWGRDLKPDNIAVIILDPGSTASEAIVASARHGLDKDTEGKALPLGTHSMLVPARAIVHMCTCDDPFEFVGPITHAAEIIEQNNIDTEED